MERGLVGGYGEVAGFVVFGSFLGLVKEASSFDKLGVGSFHRLSAGYGGNGVGQADSSCLAALARRNDKPSLAARASE